MDENNHRQQRHPISIKWSLFRHFILLIIFIAIAIIATIRVVGSRSIRKLSQNSIDKTAQLSISKINQLFRPINNLLKFSAQLGESKIFASTNPDSMNRFFIPILQHITQISSVDIADEYGNSYLLLRKENGWKNRLITAATVGKSSEWRDLDYNGKQRTATYSKHLAYDARQRPWYKIATQPKVAQHQVAWTAPYRFFTSGELGITATIGVKPKGDTPYVLAFDIRLKNISQYTLHQQPSENGFVAVLTSKGQIIGLPHYPTIVAQQNYHRLLLQPLHKIKVSPLTKAFTIWQKERQYHNKNFLIKVNGERWWASLRSYPLDTNNNLLIAILVPEKDLIHGLLFQQLLTLAIIFLSLIIAGILAIMLARKYSAPLKLLVQQTENISNLNFNEVKPVVSEILEVDKLAAAHNKMRVTLDSFTRYIPIDVVKTLLQHNDAAKVGGSRKYVSIFFSDISGFTTISEQTPPEILTAHMAEYFDLSLGILDQYHATIDKLIGDAIVAFWNAPQALEQHESYALDAAMELIQVIESANRRWIEEGKPALPTRFALHAGEVIVGNIGSSIRLNYTMLGDNVNLGSRLESLNKYYGTTLLVSETIQHINDEYEFRKVDRVAVKGKSKEVNIYEPLGRKGEVSQERIFFRDNYEKALDAYIQGRFRMALTEIESLVSLYPDDISVAFLHQRILLYLKNPPPPKWHGAENFVNK